MAKRAMAATRAAQIAEGPQLGVVLPSGKSVADLSPEEVFLRLCESRSEQVDAELLAAFRLIASASGEVGAS